MNDILNIKEALNIRIGEAEQLCSVSLDVMKLLQKPVNEIVINFPVKRDNGHVVELTGYRVQHNNALGPFQGGLRFHPTINLEDLKALATMKTLQAAFLDIPFGGAIGGVNIDPADFSFSEIERISRRFTFSIGNNIGADYDIICPDVNTNQQVMAWIIDTFLIMMPVTKRNMNKHAVTGKPVLLGGSHGRKDATAKAIGYILENWAKDKGLSLEGMTYSIQGMGNTGWTLLTVLSELGMQLVGLEDSSGAVLNPDGIDVNTIFDHYCNHGRLEGFHAARPVSHTEFFSQKVDIFIAAALENQINGMTAGLLDTRLVVEAAFNSVTVLGEEILCETGIDLIPDILATAGGPIVDYYEWLQNKRSESWELEEVRQKLKKRIDKTWNRATDNLPSDNSNPHDCAISRKTCYRIALLRLEKVYRERGIFP